MRTFNEFNQILQEKKIKVSGSEIKAYIAGKKENDPNYGVRITQGTPATADRSHLPLMPHDSEIGGGAVKKEMQKRKKRERAEAEAAIRARKAKNQ